MKNNNDKATAIILAGGKGERAGGNYKQFLKIGGKPIIFFSIYEFLKSQLINKIIIVSPDEKIKYVKGLVLKFFSQRTIEVISSGNTRQASAYNALCHIKQGIAPASYVVFHDAARPTISENMIGDVIREAISYGGAVVAGKATDLTLVVEGGYIRRAIPKETAYCGFTPQCFRFDYIWEAHQKARRINLLGSADNIELLLRFSKKCRIKVVESLVPVHKITFPHDVVIVKKLLKN